MDIASLHEASVQHSGRFSDFRITLLAAPSQPSHMASGFAAFVPDYSGGPILDFNEVLY